MSWSTSDRRAFVAVLNSMERTVARFYQILIVIIIAAVIGFAGWIIVQRPWGAGNQGEWFYFTGAILLVLGWAVSQLTAVNRRLRRPSWRIESNFSNEGPTKTWELRLGNADAEAADDNIQLKFSHDIQIPFGSILGDIAPDEQLLRGVASEMEHGATIEQACRRVQPEFDSWSGLQRRAYMQLISTLLEKVRG